MERWNFNGKSWGLFQWEIMGTATNHGFQGFASETMATNSRFCCRIQPKQFWGPSICWLNHLNNPPNWNKVIPWWLLLLSIISGDISVRSVQFARYSYITTHTIMFISNKPGWSHNPSCFFSNIVWHGKTTSFHVLVIGFAINHE